MNYQRPSALSKLESEIPVLKIPEEEKVGEFSQHETLNPPYVKSDYDSPKETKPYDISAARFDKESNPIDDLYGGSKDQGFEQYPRIMPESSPSEYSAFADSNTDYKYQYEFVNRLYRVIEKPGFEVQLIKRIITKAYKYFSKNLLWKNFSLII